VIKGDARPGGYLVAGGHGGIIAGVGSPVKPRMMYWPASRHTWRSEVNLSQLPTETMGVRAGALVPVPLKDMAGKLLESAIPSVSIVKDGSYNEEEYNSTVEDQVDILALTDYKLKRTLLGGFAVEGLSPYGKPASPSRVKALRLAIFSGLPVVCCGRGNTEGFAIPMSPFVAGSNLAVTKARILLMACIMKFGAYPPAHDPANPTPDEVAAVKAKAALYQGIFDSH
jgi:hypothetical protein